jgi:Cysteine-rich secretory protein family
MKTVLRLQDFEDRITPAVAIDSAYETYGWVLVNTLRQNPSAFANNIQGLINGSVNSALGFSKTDPVVTDLKGMVNRATNPANYGASLALMRATPSAGPLAWDDTLEDSARAHVNWMKLNGFAHTGMTGNRSAIPGFAENDSAPADTWGYGPPTYQSWGEDIAWAVGSLSASKAIFNAGGMTLAGLQQRAAFLDTAAYILELNSPGLGHLENLLGRDSGSSPTLPSYNAIGADINLYEAPSPYEVQDGIPEAWVSTHRFGLTRPRGTGGFVAGVVYRDANGNRSFDAGEGVAATVDIRDSAGRGVTDVLAGNNFGAFSEYLPNGTYTVTASANGAVLSKRTVTISNSNAWADLSFSGLVQSAVTSPTGTPGTLRPTMSWSGVNGATAYQVRVDDLAAGTANLFPSAATTDTSWIPSSDLVSGRTYDVLVRPLRGTAPGPWSKPTAFAVATPNPNGPTAPVATLRPTLSWNRIAGATYEVRVNDLATGQTNLFPNAETTDTSWTVPGDLVSGRSYQWQVRAVNVNGLGAWSLPSMVTIARPTATGPANGVGALRPAFTWTPVEGASGYFVQVNDVSAAKLGIFTARVNDAVWSPPTNLVSGRTYSWQVRAINASGLGGWSALESFAVGRAIPIGPGGPVAELRPTLTWAGLAGSTTYQIRVDDLTAGQTNVLVPIVSVDQAWTPGSDLTRGHTYRWWVRAVVPGASGTWYGWWSGSKDFQII